jgi:DNA-binding winged helix-turn-helix (wHTH) protein/pimeloyl-ACP methyl ester carboxylesterase
MIRFGQVVIDDAKREVRVADEVRHLEPQAFDVLWLLASHGERVVPKAEILDAVWGTHFVSESALTTRIKEIRRAVGDDGRTQSIIKNIRGTGYRFVAEIATDRIARPVTSLGVPRPARLRLKPKAIERRPGQKIAYATVGSGPPLIFMPGWISSLDAFADGTDPRAALVARLAENFAVTVFDRHGTGLSTTTDFDPGLDGSVDEVVALLDVIEGGPTTLFASSAAGPAAILAAAKNPRVDYLVFMCTYASGPALFTNAQNKANLIEVVRGSWGMGSRILADMIVPGIDAVTRSVFARFQRRTASPDVAADYIRQLYDADAMTSLADIDQPCLIMHYRDDPAIPFAGSRQLAMGIDNTELMPLEGPYHTPPRDHVEHIATTVLRFVDVT